MNSLPGICAYSCLALILKPTCRNSGTLKLYDIVYKLVKANKHNAFAHGVIWFDKVWAEAGVACISVKAFELKGFCSNDTSWHRGES